MSPTDGGRLTIGSGVDVRNATDSNYVTLGDASLAADDRGYGALAKSASAYNTFVVTGSTITNNGTINVASGTLSTTNLQNNHDINVSGGSLSLSGDWLNSGTIDQTGGTIGLYDTFVVSDLGTFTGTGGTVSIGGTLDDPGATLTVTSERTWQLSGGTIRGGTGANRLQIVDDNDGDAGGNVRVTSNDGTLDGVTLGVDTTLLNGAQVTVQNDLVLDNVTLRLERVYVDSGTAYDVGLNFSGGTQTLGGTGVVELFSDYYANNATDFEERYVRVRPTDGGSLTIGSGITVRNTTDSRFITVGDPSLPLVINGTLIAQSTQSSRNNLNLTGSTITNNGTMNVVSGTLDTINLQNSHDINVSGGSLSLSGDWLNSGTIDQTGGAIGLYDTFQVSDLGTFTGTGGIVSIGGTLDDPGATLTVTSERTWQLSGGTIRGGAGANRLQIVDDNDGDAGGNVSGNQQ